MNEKDMYIQKLKAQMYDWITNLDNLKEKVGGASAGAKYELNEVVVDLENQLTEGRAKLAELDGAADDSWHMMKEGTESIWGGISERFDSVTSKFED
jgi:hypothetical protein